ncbi:1-phosphofructokinase family hexose kinase [Actinomadura hibisca]|uniref:1-phosphofructokinase family hexose kinase n=1 Tax=Actinomadura hibisca TaxID=68565 RepID=UPI00082AD9DA|nr:hexose kinase [Actinomadura hibisca]
MILTVTLNAALDVTYETDAVIWGGSNRVAAVRERAGGKGVNVARVAAALGAPVLATGLLGGDTGAQIRADLDRTGTPHDFSAVQDASRRTLAAVATSTNEVTVFNEPGPQVTATEWATFRAHYRALLPSATIVVLSGSLPPGVPPDAYAELAAAATVPVILDADGDALTRGVAGRPALIKPNADELTRATGHTDPIIGARALLTAGAEAALVSLGPAGMLAVTPDGAWRAAPPPLSGNPTGAGDAAVAAAARSWGAPWPDLLREAVALSAAAVAAPVAGEIDAGLYRALLPEITVQGVPCPS